MTRACLLLLLLAACAADDGGVEQLRHRFSHRPVMLVASTDLPDECVESLDHAVLWYRDRSATLVLEHTDPRDPVLNGIATAGEVGVLPGKLSTGVRGETRLALSLTGEVIVAAEIVLAECDDITVAHEIGHALGLVHVPQQGNLMFLATEGAGWALTDEQLRWVAD